jgi:exopolyphosphatase/guanosine-5'-triphosphate,3'-diphosphate pyrophosphatase
MTREQLEECLEKIICSTQAQRDLNDRIIPIRKKMAPVSAVKTRWVLEKLKTKEILISPYSLKEGALVTA